MPAQKSQSKSPTGSSSSSAEPAYALPLELEAAVKAAHDALGRRKTLDAAVNESPAQIAEAESEVERLRGELATAEADLALSSGTDSRRLERLIDELSASLSSKEVVVRRAHARLAALEAKAPELDAAIVDARQTLNLEAGMYARDLKSQISVELREAVKPVLAVLRNAHAVDSVGLHQFTDFFFAAYLPDPETFIGSGRSENKNIGTNLLDDRSTDEQNPIALVLAPVKAAMTAIGAHRPYVPLAKRPKPYVRRGAWDGPGGRTERPEEVEEPPPVLKTIEEAQREPYVRKGRTDGVRTWNRLPAAEVDIGKALMQAADSAEHRG
jgi:hypothetical protein